MKGCEPLTDMELVNVANVIHGRHQHRNRALWWLGCQTGWRVSELLSLDIADVQGPDGCLKSSIEVQRRHTKGKQDSKVCVLSPETAGAVAAWLRDARARNGAERTWPLFHDTRGRRLTRFGAAKFVRRAMRDAGIRHASLGTHVMRKTAIRIFWEGVQERKQAGEQINDIAETLKFTGHRTVDSLLKYMATIDGLVREVVLEQWRRIGRIRPTLETPKPTRKPVGTGVLRKMGTK